MIDNSQTLETPAPARKKKPRIRKFEAAVAQEMRAWQWMDTEHKGLVLAFCWCVEQRLAGKDPEQVLTEMNHKKENP